MGSVASLTSDAFVGEGSTLASLVVEALDLCEACATRATPVELEWAGPHSLLPLVGDPPMKHPVQLASVDDQC